MFFALFLLWLIPTLRSEYIGDDYPGYVRRFYSIARYGPGTYREMGYAYFNYVISFIGTHYVTLGGAVNAMLLVPLYYYIRNTVDRKYYAIALLVFAANPYTYLWPTFAAMRQTCASGILLLAVLQLKKDKKLPFLLLVLLAYQFHHSSMGVLLLLLIKAIKWTKRKWFIFAAICFSLGVLPILDLMGYVAVLLGYDNYAIYVPSLLNHPAYFVLITFYVFILCSHYNGLYSSDDEKFFIDIFMFTACILLFVTKNVIFYRARTIFVLISIPAIPIIFKNRKEHKSLGIWGRIYTQMYLFYVVGFYCSFILALFFGSRHSGAFIPFRFFFQ